MSKETIKQTAATMFASTAHQVLWANPKGEFFTSENIGNLSLKPGQKLEKFERPQDVPEIVLDEKVVVLNTTKTIEAIQKVVSLEELKGFEADERKTVKEAYAKRNAELTAAITVTGANTETGATDGAAGTETNGNKETDTQK